jgi:hypothetical protein
VNTALISVDEQQPVPFWIGRGRVTISLVCSWPVQPKDALCKRRDGWRLSTLSRLRWRAEVAGVVQITPRPSMKSGLHKLGSRCCNAATSVQHTLPTSCTAPPRQAVDSIGRSTLLTQSPEAGLVPKLTTSRLIDVLAGILYQNPNVAETAVSHCCRPLFIPSSAWRANPDDENQTYPGPKIPTLQNDAEHG